MIQLTDSIKKKNYETQINSRAFSKEHHIKKLDDNIIYIFKDIKIGLN